MDRPAGPGWRALPVVALLGAAVATPAVADEATILRCWFTEPGLTTDYRPDRRLLVVTDPVSDYPSVRRRVYRNVVRVDRPGGRVELRAGSVVLARMIRNGRGSDGMSDRRYPYSVEAPPVGPRRDGGCDRVEAPPRPGGGTAAGARRPIRITKP